MAWVDRHDQWPHARCHLDPRGFAGQYRTRRQVVVACGSHHARSTIGGDCSGITGRCTHRCAAAIQDRSCSCATARHHCARRYGSGGPGGTVRRVAGNASRRWRTGGRGGGRPRCRHTSGDGGRYRGLSDSGHRRCRHRRGRRRRRRLRRRHRRGTLRRCGQGCSRACRFGLCIERARRRGCRRCSRSHCGGRRRRRIAGPFDHQCRRAAQRLHLRFQRGHRRCQFEHHTERARHRLTGAHRGHQSGSSRQLETAHARGFWKIHDQARRVRQRQRFEAAAAGQLNLRTGPGGSGTDADPLDFAAPGSKNRQAQAGGQGGKTEVADPRCHGAGFKHPTA